MHATLNAVPCPEMNLRSKVGLNYLFGVRMDTMDQTTACSSINSPAVDRREARQEVSAVMKRGWLWIISLQPQPRFASHCEDKGMAYAERTE